MPKSWVTNESAVSVSERPAVEQSNESESSAEAFSQYDEIPCLCQTDRRTQGHSIYHASIASRGKNTMLNLLSSDFCFSLSFVISSRAAAKWPFSSAI